MNLLTELDRLHDSATKGVFHGEKWCDGGHQELDWYDKCQKRHIFSEEHRQFLAALANAYPELRKRLLAAEKLAEAVEGMDVENPNDGDYGEGWEDGSSEWREKRDAVLAAYREALK